MINKKNNPFTQKIFSSYFFLLLAYLAFIFYGSLVPIHFQAIPLDQVIAKFTDQMIRPMSFISRSDFVANFFLFAPLAFLAMQTFTPEDTRQIHPRTAFLVWLGACTIGLSIEFIQVYFPARTVSRMDVVAQAIGSFWGILLWIALAKPLTARASSFWHNRIAGRPFIKILLLYALVLAVKLLMPLDLTLSPFNLYHKFKFGGIILIPFSESLPFDIFYVKAIRMIPIGILFALLPTRQENVPITAALVGSCLFASLIEFLQLFVESRVTSTTDILLATIAGLFGGIFIKLYQKFVASPV
jgi:VanZ family protein